MSDYQDPLAHWQLRKTVNAAGTKTSIGASRVKPEVVQAVASMLPEFVDMDELQAAASRVIVSVTGAEAGCVTDCSAAGVCQAVAAAITGTDLALIESLPLMPTSVERRVVIPMGHMIHYGGPVPQMITVTGADLVPLGTAALCEIYHLEHALAQGCAAAVYVVSHHTVREGELPMDVFIETCQRYNTPVIVDMASEYDMTTPIELGASAVVYSGHKFLSGVTSGVVAGKLDMIRAVYLQSRGLGRLMKVGKESVVGVMTALELWQQRDIESMRVHEQANLDVWLQHLAGVPGIAIELHHDWTGNPITRVKLTVNGNEAGVTAWELSERLAKRTPRIMVRDDLVEHHEIYLDPCNLTMAEAQSVAQGIVAEVHSATSQGDGCRETWSDVKRRRGKDPLGWPDGYDPA